MAANIRNWRTEEQQAFPNQLPVDNSNYLNIVGKMAEEQNARLAKSGEIMANQILNSPNQNQMIAGALEKGVEGYYTGKTQSEESANRRAQLDLQKAQLAEAAKRTDIMGSEEQRAGKKFGLEYDPNDALGGMSNFQLNQNMSRETAGIQNKATKAQTAGTQVATTGMVKDQAAAAQSSKLNRASQIMGEAFLAGGNDPAAQQSNMAVARDKLRATGGYTDDELMQAMSIGRSNVVTTQLSQQAVQKQDPDYNAAMDFHQKATSRADHINSLDKALQTYVAGSHTWRPDSTEAGEARENLARLVEEISEMKGLGQQIRDYKTLANKDLSSTDTFLKNVVMQAKDTLRQKTASEHGMLSPAAQSNPYVKTALQSMSNKKKIIRSNNTTAGTGFVADVPTITGGGAPIVNVGAKLNPLRPQ